MNVVDRAARMIVRAVRLREGGQPGRADDLLARAQDLLRGVPGGAAEGARGAAAELRGAK